ncbi:MAG: hypothetical protein ACREXX_11575 [Gammaproteobacteria bacterium]
MSLPVTGASVAIEARRVTGPGRRVLAALALRHSLPRRGENRGAVLTILLVEDNEMSRDMLGRRLARRGYRVLFSVDADIAMAVSPKPDRALMDLGLPVAMAGKRCDS